MFNTGKHLVTFMPDGTARNNIGSPEVARAVAFYSKLLQSRTMTTSDAYKAFAAGTVAMSIGHRWVANDCAKLIQADSLGVAPLPRDPDADQYYTEEEAAASTFPRARPTCRVPLLAATYTLTSSVRRPIFATNMSTTLITAYGPKSCRSSMRGTTSWSACCAIGNPLTWAIIGVICSAVRRAESRGKPSRRSFLPRWTPGSRSFTKPRNKEYCAVNGGCDGLLFTAQYTCCQ